MQHYESVGKSCEWSQGRADAPLHPRPLRMLVALLHAGCYATTARTRGKLHATQTLGWLNRPVDNEFYYSKSSDIPIAFVEISKKNEAILLLNDIFYKKLTDKEYVYYTGTTGTGSIKGEIKNAYLIRSVNYSFSEHGYKIYKSDKNNLLISHKVLGNGNGKGIQKWPIIIFYDDLEKINKIYTSYSVVK
ncbi:MAG: hypothetical protein Ta2A_08770 [Treponemataceae bacterium]|nr:MAG: hypothetical protein Ta2A_08770 [Treponemataceae bacterium]